MEQSHSVENAPEISEGNETAETQDKLNGKPVAFKTYDKTIKTLKEREAKLNDLQNKLTEYEKAEDTRREQLLAEQGEYKKLLEVKESKLKELMAKEQVREKETVMQLKASAFLDKLPGQLVSNEYLAFAELDNIAFNPETNTVDELSLEPVVNDFVKNHARLYTAKGGPKLPSGAPQPSQPRGLSDLSIEEKIKLLVEKSK